jgi:hypothetical protein
LKTFIAKLVASGYIIETLASGKNKFMGICKLSPDLPARRIDILVADKSYYYFALLYFTGSYNFNIYMRRKAIKKGLSLSEYGFKDINTKIMVDTSESIKSEEDIFQYIEIPYIPMQRWVHIAVVINENANGGTIVAYVDGDISKIASSGELDAAGGSIKVNNLNLDNMGALHVGGTFEGNIGPGFSGLISKIALFNYDLNDKDIYDDYNKGPLNGFLSSLGLANYGLRSPIYKLT